MWVCAVLLALFAGVIGNRLLGNAQSVSALETVHSPQEQLARAQVDLLLATATTHSLGRRFEEERLVEEGASPEKCALAQEMIEVRRRHQESFSRLQLAIEQLRVSSSEYNDLARRLHKERTALQDWTDEEQGLALLARLEGCSEAGSEKAAG